LGIPRREENWEEAVRRADPEVKPATTGVEMSVTSPPRRKSAKRSCRAATVRESRAASWTRSSDGSLARGGSTTPPLFHVDGMAFAVRMHMMAVGPTMSCGLDPVSA
jgi:hypothetical protein